MKQTLNDDEVIQIVKQIFIEIFEIDEERLVPEAKLFDDLGLDSLDAVDLVANLQGRFDITLRNDDRIRSIRTLDDLYKLVLVVKHELGEKEASPPPSEREITRG